MSDASSRLREIPQVSALLEDRRMAVLLEGRRRRWVLGLVHAELEALRTRLARAAGPVREREQLLNEVVETIEKKYVEMTSPAWTRVLNGTGVLVHTNLGRSNLPPEAVRAMGVVAAGTSDLEFDLDRGARGHRGRRVEAKAAALAGAGDALVVNNNAAAVWLAVRGTAAGGRVVLSRGEIVAIGGSFRIHEILAETGCRLVEVGTTNRTSLADYAAALEPGATVLKVHRSNFTVSGFTEEVGLPELVELGRARGCPVIYDAGSGALVPMAGYGLPAGERELHEDVATGVDLVTCSGDKLLGGCQAGLVLGSAARVAALRAHPMRRTFRVDKTTLAALDAVLSLYLAATEAPALPTLAMLAADTDTLAARAARLGDELREDAPDGWCAEVVAGVSSVGGGAFSDAELPTRLLRWSGPKEELEACHRLLRRGDPALVARMGQDGLAVDLRTLSETELPAVAEAFRGAWRNLAAGHGAGGGSEGS